MAGSELIARALWLAGLFGLLWSSAATAGRADVLLADIQRSAPEVFEISVSVRHADSGWDHYANRWEVLGPEDQILATRVLRHPHVQEQPFRRSLGNIRIPRQFTWVKIRAHDLQHGYGGRTVTLSVPHAPSGN